MSSRQEVGEMMMRPATLVTVMASPRPSLMGIRALK